MKLHHCEAGIECLRIANATIRQVSRIPNNWIAEVPQVNPNLIRATGLERGFEQGGSVGASFEDAKIGARWLTFRFVDAVRAELIGLG